MTLRIAIIGGGPSALYLYKKLCETPMDNFEVDIFEAGHQIGCGMPYSNQGASIEHITNISSDETPDLSQTFVQWIKSQPAEVLRPFNVESRDFNPHKPIPRLLFGQYLASQFELLIVRGIKQGIPTNIHLNCRVLDVEDHRERAEMTLVFADGVTKAFDIVIMSTGHSWPVTYEGKVQGYFDSPYPPAKLERDFDCHIAIRGTSLTAIDAIRTLARQHGNFTEVASHKVVYKAYDHFKDFKITLHSTHGLLPAVRFHQEDRRLEEKLMFKAEEISEIRNLNGGFVPLDLIFERKFKDQFRDKDPEFFAYIKNLGSSRILVGDFGDFRASAGPRSGF